MGRLPWSAGFLRRSALPGLPGVRGQQRDKGVPRGLGGPPYGEPAAFVRFYTTDGARRARRRAGCADSGQKCKII